MARLWLASLVAIALLTSVSPAGGQEAGAPAPAHPPAAKENAKENAGANEGADANAPQGAAANEVEGANASAEAPAPAAPAGPRMTLHVYEDELSPEAADAVEEAMGEELAVDNRVAFRDLRSIVDPPDAAARGLGMADLDIVDADQAFAGMDLDRAITLLEHGLMQYRRHLPQLRARGGGIDPLRDAYLKLARARFVDGNLAGTKDALRYAFVLDPTVTFSTSFFPKNMKKVFSEAKQLSDSLGTGRVVIDSDPPGATAYLNGSRLPKSTPTEPVGARAGPNFVTLERRGYAPITLVLEVPANSAEPAATLQALARYPGNPLQPLDRARLLLDKPETPASLKEGAKALGVDLLALVRFSKVDDGSGVRQVRLVAYLYDARPDHIIKRSERTVSPSEVAPSAHALAHILLEGTRLDGVWIPPAPPRQPSWQERLSARAKAFRHSKYFWPVIGGVIGAVVIGASVGIGVAASQNHGPTAGEQIILLGGR